MNKFFKSLIIIGACCTLTVTAADLPTTGLSTPDYVTLQSNPNGDPNDPSAPIGSGLLVMLSAAGLYAFTKRKKAA